MRLRQLYLLAIALLLMAALTACNLPFVPAGDPSATPVPSSPTAQVVKETVVVVVTSTLAPTSTAANTAVPAAATATATAAAKATATPTRTVGVQPTPTALALLNIPIEGGDPNNMFFASLVFPNFKPAATSFLWFRVAAHKPVSSKKDGEGIESVTFTIRNSKGQAVHFREEKTAGYCAFGGGEPDCEIWYFAARNYTWPDGGKITSGDYTIFINATSKDGVNMNGKANFKIQVP